MREFEKQIKFYKAKLPHMRERLIAALVMLLIASIMMVSASFAWVVLSVNPEIKGMATTITANGNLEIALANGTTITPPVDSQIGDSGKDLLQKNITWGNLVNLADPAYGLENIVLRPATLNENSLIDQPLYAAGYGTDGRVDQTESNFAYAYWNVDQFSADKVKYGVRTIASVTYGEIGQNSALADAVKAADTAKNTAINDLKALAKHGAMQELVGLMAAYVQAQIDEKTNGGTEPIVNVTVAQIDAIILLMQELKTNMELSADALASIYNISMLRRAGQAYVSENKFTGEYLLTETKTNIQTKLAQKNAAKEVIVTPAMVEQLWTLKTDYQTVVDDLAVIETLKGRNDVVYRNLRGSEFPAIETYVNHIASVGDVTVNGVALGKLSMSNIFSLTGGGVKPIVITKGIIQRMDKFTGARIESNTLQMTVMGSTAKGTATTSATEPFVLPTEHDNSIAGDSSYKGTDPIAGDTFGMALDFFVRTNAPNSHLILQGSPVYEERDEVVTVNVDGGVYNLYKLSNGEEEVTAYLNTEDDTYYYYDRESGIAGDAIGKKSQISNATLITEKVKYVVGYNGANRVWDSTENANIDLESTTQGAGSCYVFYASSPEDQNKALQLLEHFRIAFIDQNGNLLGRAQLNTEKKSEKTGKVTVPLELSVTNNSITGPDGNPLYTITALERNTPTFITAIIYLDGLGLTNDQVLAAGEIQGQLNIQFGTTADLDAMDDPILMEAKYSIHAEMEGAKTVNIDTATAADLKKKIILTVTGQTPSKIKAYFLREVNSTQGVRQGEMNFEIQDDGKWVGEYQFTAAGKYILREVMLDGIMYELNVDPIVFTVEGFAISSVFCEHNNRTFMTTDKTFDTSVSLTFATNDPSKMPTSVKGAFVNQKTGNRTTVYFSRSVGSTWTGNATFTTTGDYKMDYVELDNQYTGLDESKHITINLYLGLSASVYTGETNFALEKDEARDIPMSLIIKTDTGETINNLQGVYLHYSKNTSGVQETGLGANMIWNSSRKMYEGSFRLENAGIYRYSFVEINIQDERSYLNTALEAPVITAISSTRPKYSSKSGFGEVFALNNDASFKIRMKDADSATIDAAIKNENDETYYVRGVMTDLGAEQEFVFTLPIIEGDQEGTWTLDGIYMTNVYGGTNNTLFDGSIENGPDTATDDKPMYTVGNNYYFRWWKWDMDALTLEDESDENKAGVITVVSNVNVSFSDSELNNDKNFGKTGNNVTATFGTQHTLGNLELLVTVGNSGKPISDYGIEVESVELTYNYDQTGVIKSGDVVTNSFGSYTMNNDSWTKLTSNSNTQYIYNNIAKSGSDDTKYIISPSKTSISVAGRYKATGTLKLGIKSSSGDTATISVSVNDLSEPTFIVWSKAMSVAIKSIAPNKADHKSVNKTAETEVTRTSSFSGNTAKVYCEAHKSGNNIAFDTYPYVELTLSDMGDNADSVSLPFTRSGGGEVYLYTAEKMSNKTTEYAWSASGDCTRYVGQYKASSTCSSTSFIGAGTLTANSLNIVMGEYTYNMSVDTITIINPHIEDE